jgi:hypothetical protein
MQRTFARKSTSVAAAIEGTPAPKSTFSLQQLALDTIITAMKPVPGIMNIAPYIGGRSQRAGQRARA